MNILFKVIRVMIHIYTDIFLITSGLLGIMWIAVKVAA